MNSIIVFFIILFISVMGYSIIKGFNLLSGPNKIAAVPYSFGLGVGLISMQLFIYSRLNIIWSRELIIFPWLVLIAVLFIKSKKKVVIHFPKLSKFGKIELILLIGILASVSYVVFESLIRPATTWDSWATWLLESKVFYIDGKVNPDVFNYLNSDYPLIFKLLGTFVYIILGRIDDSSVLLVSSAFYVFLCLLIFTSLNRRYGIRYSLLFTFMFMTIQNFVRHGGRMEAGLADLPLSYYSFACFTLLINYIKNSSYKAFLLLNIFLGITMLIKLEGIPIAILIGLFSFLYIHKQKLYKHFIMIIFWILPFIDWQLYRKVSHVGTYYLPAHPIELSIQKSINSILGTFKEFINMKSWNMLWITYFYSFFVLNLKNKKDLELTILNIIILSQLCLYLLIYIFTSGNAPESSIERLLIHVAPMAIYYIAIRVKGALLFKDF